jgi:hypothetical protein
MCLQVTFSSPQIDRTIGRRLEEATGTLKWSRWDPYELGMDACALMADEADFEDETGYLSEAGRRELGRTVSAVLDVLNEVDVMVSDGEPALRAETVSRDAFLALVDQNAVRNRTRYRVRLSRLAGEESARNMRYPLARPGAIIGRYQRIAGLITSLRTRLPPKRRQRSALRRRKAPDSVMYYVSIPNRGYSSRRDVAKWWLEVGADGVTERELGFDASGAIV